MVVGVDLAATMLLAAAAVGVVGRALVEEPHGRGSLDVTKELLGELARATSVEFITRSG